MDKKDNRNSTRSGIGETKKKILKNALESPQKSCNLLRALTSTHEKSDDQKNQFPSKSTSVCDISENFLKGKSVKPTHRMQLKQWLMTQMRNIQMFRQTYASASRYLDMYFSKGKDVQIRSFQNLGIACFMLAGKTIQRNCPSFTFSNYNVSQILKFEAQLCNVLQFDIFPITYFHLAENIMYEWEEFSIQQTNYQMSYFSKQDESMNRYREIMDILDFIDLMPNIYAYRLEDIVLCVFYLKNYHFLNSSKNYPLLTQLEEFHKDLYEEYNVIFYRFMSAISEHEYFQSPKISLKILKFVRPFMEMPNNYTGTVPTMFSTYSELNSNEYRYNMLIQNLNPIHIPKAKQEIIKTK